MKLYAKFKSSCQRETNENRSSSRLDSSDMGRRLVGGTVIVVGRVHLSRVRLLWMWVMMSATTATYGHGRRCRHRRRVVRCRQFGQPPLPLPFLCAFGTEVITDAQYCDETNKEHDEAHGLGLVMPSMTRARRQEQRKEEEREERTTKGCRFVSSYSSFSLKVIWFLKKALRT